jgi:hypothetical protein
VYKRATVSHYNPKIIIIQDISSKSNSITPLSPHLNIFTIPSSNMKSSVFVAVLLAGVSSVTGASLPQRREPSDGLYQVSVDEDGNTVTNFTPYDEVVDVSLQPRSPLEKRREACGPGSVDINLADQANACVINGISGDRLTTGKNAWTYVGFSSQCASNPQHSQLLLLSFVIKGWPPKNSGGSC